MQHISTRPISSDKEEEKTPESFEQVFSSLYDQY